MPDRDFYIAEILKALPNDMESWDSRHRFYLAMNFALDGSEEARQSMYAAYDPGRRFGESIGGTFVQMDGIKGFLFAADKIGGLLLAGCENLDQGWLQSTAVKELGEETAWKALLSAKELRSKLASTELSFQLPRWGRQAPDAEFKKAAQGLLAAVEPDEQVGHLRIFRRVAFPFGPEPLLALARSPHPSVAYSAIPALARLTHPKARELAFHLIATNSPYRDEAIAFLCTNFEPGDHAVALDWFRAERDPETIHNLSGDLRKLWEKHPQPETEVPMLLAVYERDPCSFNRWMVLRRLLELSAVSAAMREECAWDANDQIRALVT